jgi:diguanylate cyclase (GGDEF)-like protein/PAS domain S-box-containing protein
MTVISTNEIGTQVPRSVGHRWQLVEMAFAATFTGAALLTLVSGGTTQQAAVVASGLLGAAAIVVGVHRHRPSSPSVWWSFAAALGIGGVARVVDDALQTAITHTPMLDILPTTLYVIGYGCFLAGLLLLSRHLFSTSDRRADLLDTGILFTATGFIAWEVVVHPLLTSSSLPGVMRTITALHPAFGALLVALVLRILLGARERSLPLVALVLSSACSLGAELIPAIGASGGTDGNLDANDLLTIGAAAFLSLVALRASMTTLTATTIRSSDDLGVGRIAALAAAMLTCPIAIVISATALHNAFDPIELLLPSTVVTVLIVMRLRLLFIARRDAEAEVVGREYRFRSLIENLNDLVLLVGVDGNVLYQSPSVEHALGFAPDALIGGTFDGLVPDSEEAILHALGAESLGQPGIAVHGVIRAYDASRTVHTYEMTLTNLLDQPDIAGMVAVLHDVTERKQLEGELRNQALHDALTGLPNRALFIDRATRLLEIAHRDHVPVSALFIDLDNFKTINDGLGHNAGDELLIAIGKRMTNAMRGADTVCRFGGDEFVVLVNPHATNAAPELMAARLRDVLRAPFEVCGHFISITSSIGIASGHDITVDELIRNADIAMYQAKAAGKNATTVFQPEMQSLASDRLQLEIDLRHAVTHHEFAVLYQPTIDLHQHAMTGMEALVRWDHPTRGRLAPSEFIAVAEDTGIIVDIGRFVLTEACTKAALWQRDGAPITVAVNLSTRQLESDQLIDDVRRVLEETDLDAAALVLEVTETTIMRDTDAVVGRLTALKKLGVRLAIDDFGTGYSSLSYLRQFPIDILKIDQSFVASLLGSSESAAIVHSLIELGRTLHLEIVAEGVEMESQLLALEAEHCDTAQGYLFARPLEAAQLEIFLAEWTLGRRRVVAPRA